MNGVVILNSYEYLANQSTIILFMCLCVCFSIASLTILYVLLKDKLICWETFTILIICVALAITCGCLIPKDDYETRYQVTVDDSVTMSEFQSKYEIIEVEGKIYTVRDRVE